jgi:hypothetical protein
VVSTTGCLLLALLPTYVTIDVSFPGLDDPIELPGLARAVPLR